MFGWGQPYAGLIDVQGTLYGTTGYGGTYYKGTVFALDPGTGSETVLHSFGNGRDGRIPAADLLAVSGLLYGTTTAGGTYRYGTVFALDPETGAETTLHSFGKGLDGRRPYGGFIDINGRLYGSTLDGGANGRGSLFALTNP